MKRGEPFDWYGLAYAAHKLLGADMPAFLCMTPIALHKLLDEAMRSAKGKKKSLPAMPEDIGQGGW